MEIRTAQDDTTEEELKNLDIKRDFAHFSIKYIHYIPATYCKSYHQRAFVSVLPTLVHSVPFEKSKKKWP